MATTKKTTTKTGTLDQKSGILGILPLQDAVTLS